MPDWFFQRVGGEGGRLDSCVPTFLPAAAPSPWPSPPALLLTPLTNPPHAAAPQTGQELKAAFLSATRRREQDQARGGRRVCARASWALQGGCSRVEREGIELSPRRPRPQVLMTRATRERLKGAPRPEAAFATVRVRFPEGISLQARWGQAAAVGRLRLGARAGRGCPGAAAAAASHAAAPRVAAPRCGPPPAQGEFSAGEPVAALFAWVADSLADPLHTYDLVLPSRQPLEPAPQSGARAGRRGGGRALARVLVSCPLHAAPAAVGMPRPRCRNPLPPLMPPLPQCARRACCPPWSCCSAGPAPQHRRWQRCRRCGPTCCARRARRPWHTDALTAAAVPAHELLNL